MADLGKKRATFLPMVGVTDFYVFFGMFEILVVGDLAGENRQAIEAIAQVKTWNQISPGFTHIGRRRHTLSLLLLYWMLTKPRSRQMSLY